MSKTTNFISFKMDFHAGYFADELPFSVEVIGDGQIHYSRIDNQGMGEGVEVDWKIGQEELAKLSELVGRLFEYKLEDESTIMDGGSTSFEITFSNGSKKSIDRSHSENVPRSFINLEHEIEIDPSGQVFYIGKDWVAVPGVESWNLPIRKLKEVNRIAQEIYDTELTLNEDEQQITDMPSYKIKFTKGLKANEAEFYLQGCDGMEEFESKINYIHELIGVTDLIYDESIGEETI